MKRIEVEFERVDPENLLEEDQYLVQEYNLQELTDATDRIRRIRPTVYI